MITDNIQLGILLISIILGYLYLFSHPIRWVRLIATIGIMVLSLEIGILTESLIAYSFFGINLIICGIKLTEELSNVVKYANKVN